MAKKQVIAHFMHESERDAVVPHLSNPTITDSYVLGDIEEADMPALEQQGIIFQELTEAQEPAPEVPAPEERVLGTTNGPGPDPAPALRGPVGSDMYYLTLSGPLLPQWRMQLEALGADFRVGLPDYRWIARIPPGQVAAVQALPFVKDLKMRESDRNLPTKQELARFGTPNNVREMLTYDILLDRAAPLDKFRAWLEERGIAIAASEANKVRIHLLDHDPLLQDIAEQTDWVIDIQPYVPPELHNDRARVLLGVDGSPTAVPQFHFPLEGDGEIVGVADTGLDEAHCDIAGHIKGVVALGRENDASDPHGHGTHVTGSILGNGCASQGAIRGVAPHAQVFFQSLLDHNGKLGGLPFRLNTLFAEAYQAGARIHNNSWGAATMAEYQANSLEVDEYVHGQKDMLIVISAGNEGTAADPLVGTRNSIAGSVDWLSVGDPATAKNALTVGASRSDRSVGGYSSLTYGNAWPLKFPVPQIAQEMISGDPESMAAFSSRGPCDDLRIKPDVVAPGTDILSCKSSSAPLRNFWGPDPINPNYAYMGGTSMAAPLVSGCAALVRQYYRQDRSHMPSAALLKATLINSTRTLTGASSIAEFATLPNYHQGFGCIYLPHAVPNSLVPQFGLEYYDNWSDPMQYFTASGQRRRFSITLNAGGWLRVTLAYTDPPARALINNLNLFLELPDRSKKFGNMDAPQGLNRPDTKNNVEVIRLDDALPGRYLIQITAQNLFQPQDFALVITGKLSTPITEV